MDVAFAVLSHEQKLSPSHVKLQAMSAHSGEVHHVSGKAPTNKLEAFHCRGGSKAATFGCAPNFLQPALGEGMQDL